MEPETLKQYEPVILFGGGGHGHALIDTLRHSSQFKLAGIVDDHLAAGSEVMGVPVLGGQAVLHRIHKSGICLAVNGVGGIGNVDARMKVFDLLSAEGFDFPIVVHPTAWIEPSASLEKGVQVLARAVVGAQCQVGFGSVLNIGTILSHDNQIGKVVNLSPGAILGGSVSVGDYSQIGMGVTINLNVKIGRRARIGNGATVKADVPDEFRIYAGAIYPPRAPEKDANHE